MSLQEPYEVGIASIFIDEETETQKDERTCPKSQTGGEAGLGTQAVGLLRGHVLGWVSKRLWRPLPPSGEFLTQRE